MTQIRDVKFVVRLTALLEGNFGTFFKFTPTPCALAGTVWLYAPQSWPHPPAPPTHGVQCVARVVLKPAWCARVVRVDDDS